MASIGWDEKVETKDSSFMVLPEGEYPFEVVEFQRLQHKASAKIGACPMADYELRVEGPEGSTTVHYFLLLDDSLTWKITEFFKGIKAIDPETPEGTKLEFPWDGCIGKTGRCKVSVRKWTGDDGVERESNQVDRIVKPKNDSYGSL